MLRTFFLLLTVFLLQYNGYAQTFLDSTFGTNGFTITRPPAISPTPKSGLASVTIQTDGKIVTSAYSSGGLAQVIRYKQNGVLDSSFAANGIFRLSTSGMDVWNMNCNKVMLQPDGKILAVGAGNVTGNDYAVIRLNTDGSIDTSFATIGGVLLDVSFYDEATSIALQNDGKIILAGTCSSHDSISMVRFYANGIIDSTFGTNGKVKANPGFFGGHCNGVAVLVDGKILIGGSGWNGASNSDSADDYLLMRFNSDGSADTGFNHVGRVYINVGHPYDFSGDMMMLTNGKILLTGNSDANLTLLRYNSDGTLDTTFNHIGIVESINTWDTKGVSIVYQPDGRIIIGGQTNQADTNRFILLRYNDNGSLDSSFGANGAITTALRHFGGESLGGIALQADGALVAVGYSSNTDPGPGFDCAIARFLPQVTTGIAAVKKLTGITVFPNPATNEIQLINKSGLSIVQLDIVDMNGRVVKHISHSESIIPMTDVPDGMYQVCVVVKGGARQTISLLIHHN